MPQAAQQVPSRFRELTRQQLSYIPQQQMNVFGNTYTFGLGNTGYVANIYLMLSGTVTIPATPTGNWQTYPPLPYSLIRRLRIYTSENVELLNLSGWGLMFFLLRQKRLSTPPVDPIPYLNAAGRAALLTVPSGALVAGAIPISGWFKVPIMTDDATMLGLLLIQTLDIRCYLEITMASASDLVTTGATLPSACAINVTPTVEFFSIPPGANQPNLAWVHTITEEIFPLTTTGDIIYRPPIGNVYMSLSGIIENSGAQLPPANINQVSLAYAQSVRPYYEPYLNHLARNKWNYGLTMPDGAFSFDFSLGSGDPGSDEPRDFLNSSQQTDLQILINATGFTPVNGQIRVIREQLASIG